MSFQLPVQDITNLWGISPLVAMVRSTCEPLYLFSGVNFLQAPHLIENLSLIFFSRSSSLLSQMCLIRLLDRPADDLTFCYEPESIAHSTGIG